MLKILISVSLLSFGLHHAGATGCYELHQAQLTALNERMNQMIDTISSLLPKPLKKPKLPLPSPVAPAVDYSVPSTIDKPYYTSPPVYTAPPQIVYASPSYAPIPTAVFVPPVQNAPLPQYYPQMEIGSQPDKLPTVSPPLPPSNTINIPYEGFPLPQYANMLPIHQPSAQYLVPYSYVQPSSDDHSLQTTPTYTLPVPVHPNIPLYSPGLPQIPLPVYSMYPQVPPLQYP